MAYLWYNSSVEHFFRPTRIFLQLFQTKKRNIVTNVFFLWAN